VRRLPGTTKITARLGAVTTAPTTLARPLVIDDAGRNPIGRVQLRGVDGIAPVKGGPTTIELRGRPDDCSPERRLATATVRRGGGFTIAARPLAGLRPSYRVVVLKPGGGGARFSLVQPVG
jgi:hypothetical protein